MGIVGRCGQCLPVLLRTFGACWQKSSRVTFFLGGVCNHPALLEGEGAVTPCYLGGDVLLVRVSVFKGSENRTKKQNRKTKIEKIFAIDDFLLSLHRKAAQVAKW